MLEYEFCPFKLKLINRLNCAKISNEFVLKVKMNKTIYTCIGIDFSSYVLVFVERIDKSIPYSW